jgi:serine/threonine-protein kinase
VTERISLRVIANALGTLIIFGTLLLARSNLRAGRGDRRGAWRLFCFAFAVQLAAWVVSARHYNSLLVEDGRFFEFVGFALRRIGTIWLLYIALEPYVRRFAPGILMSWTRVLGGQFVDPRVGRDVLVGVAVGVGIALFGLCRPCSARRRRSPAPQISDCCSAPPQRWGSSSG